MAKVKKNCPACGGNGRHDGYSESPHRCGYCNGKGYTEYENFASNAPAGGSKKAKGDCFVATAAFGSEECKELDILREFRDKTLLSSRLGRTFVKFYYIYGSSAAEKIKGRPIPKTLIRSFLRPLCRILEQMNRTRRSTQRR